MFGCQHGLAPQYLIAVYTGLRCGITAAPSFSQSTSSGRTASPSQHVRPPGFCCGWPGTLSQTDNLRDPDVTTDNFKRLLKTFLFSAYIPVQLTH